MNKFIIDLGSDAQNARMMAAQLDTYLYQDELYGALAPNRPRLTVGGLLLRLHRLGALRDRLTPSQAADFESALDDLAEARENWAIHYNQKIAREVKARQTSMTWYLENCDEKQGDITGAYPIEAEKRTILHHLFNEEHELAELRERQAELDAWLRRHVVETDFIWPETVQPAYPPAPFWWLYRWPKKEDT